MPKKRRFGRVRALPSGRFQARYPGPDGVDRPAPSTFATKRDAERWLTKVEGEILQGIWSNPDLGRVPLGQYLTEWIDHRPNLRPRTVDLYRWLYQRHIAPSMRDVLLSNITSGMVRAWRADLLSNGVSVSMAAKAYRLLRAVLNTAVDDELIRRNPCRIKRAGQENTPERPVAAVPQVFKLAGLVPARFRVLVLLAAFTSLRYGELAALRRSSIGPKCETVTVTSAMVELRTGELVFGPPKSDAGRRTVTVPAAIRAEVKAHLKAYVAGDDDALVFTGANGGALRPGNFHRAANWRDNVAAVGLPGFHFHDLRHTGNTLAAGTGASLRDLMARMGHGSTRAALIYQHATQQADKAIATALDKQIRKDLDRARNGHAKRGKAS
ncbi:MAG: tyrosine-type recombinase/integrase [Micromonosporaceae bacterium]